MIRNTLREERDQLLALIKRLICRPGATRNNERYLRVDRRDLEEAQRRTGWQGINDT